MKATIRVSAVVVTHNPEPEALGRLLSALWAQVAQIIVVDNKSRPDLEARLSRLFPSVQLLILDDNYGIARAQNSGIAEARMHRSDYVLLMDQDSVPAPDMVTQLVEAAESKHAAGMKVAAVGPRYEDARRKDATPFIRVEGLRLERPSCPTPTAVIEVDYLIASGCLIPIGTLDAVGGMREDLFIDYVDIEWGLRAQRQGFQSFGACAALMSHTLGDTPARFRGRSVPVHSPLRHYYHFRNAVWLYRQPWPRLQWKIVDGARLFRRFVFYSLMTPPRLKHAGMMTLGVTHGLLGRMGKRR